MQALYIFRHRLASLALVKLDYSCVSSAENVDQDRFVLLIIARFLNEFAISLIKLHEVGARVSHTKIRVAEYAVLHLAFESVTHLQLAAHG